MNSRLPRHAPTRASVAPVHRGPQAVAAVHHAAPIQHAPNAALLIDFDNVTMGIRSDLASELRNLLSSDIIKGKVAVQRAYADWRRYPQYIVPLAESSIDMIMAPAYGSSKKNATDIRLSVDAMELVFTRPEIGTYILLSGDSDFASLVTKLKEYGKYVIGVGIRESSSDLLVMNCDEYYSYNALAGLVKSGDEEVVKWDPWELVVEAITRMAKNGDVMRSDRLKQVMQDIDSGFDEKNLGMAKFSRFVTEAATRGLISITKLENGQLEVGPSVKRAAAPAGAAGAAGAAPAADAPRPAPGAPAPDENGHATREERGRRGRRGRGRDRGERPPRGVEGAAPAESRPPQPTPAPSAAPPADATEDFGLAGERLTKDEAFDLVLRSSRALVGTNGAVLAKDLRRHVFETLGRDSESLSHRNFTRILKDAHDAEVIDLRRRGDDYEVSLPAPVAPVAEQLNRAANAHPAATPSAAPSTGAPPALRGMGPRGIPARGRGPGRPGAPPPELLAIGVVERPAAATAPPITVATVSAPPVVASDDAAPAAETPAPKARGRRGGGRPAAKKAKAAAAPAAAEAAAVVAPAAAAPAKRASRGGRGGTARKRARKDTPA